MPRCVGLFAIPAIIFATFALAHIRAQSPGPEINGQIFIVTGAHESVKLGLVAVAAFETADLDGRLLDVTERTDAERMALAKVIQEIEAFADRAEIHEKREFGGLNRAAGWQLRLNKAISIAEYARKLRERAQWRRNYLESAAPFFKAFPQPVALTKSDADGKFKLTLPDIGSFAIAATTDRAAPNETETYFWLIRVLAKNNTALTLANDNLTEAPSSESLIHTKALARPRGESESAEMLASDLAIAQRNAASFLAGSPTPAPPTPGFVTLVKPISLTIQYGAIEIRAGAKLTLLFRNGDKARVRYGDADYDVPIAYTDLQ